MADLEIEVLDVRVALPNKQPVLLLKDINSARVLRMWVGTPEASAIAMAQNDITGQRPLPHQLIVNALQAAGDELASVRISDFDDEIFYAQLVLSSGETVDSRTTDAVAIALHAGVNVYCEAAVMDEAGMEIAEMTASEEDHMTQPTPEEVIGRTDVDEEDVDEFREFLEHITPEDFIDDSGDDPVK